MKGFDPQAGPGQAAVDQAGPVDPDVVPAHGDVTVSEGSGDEVLRGEDVVATNRCQPTARR
jgi:hypothetical protein